jgi:hypothetical protein
MRASANRGSSRWGRLAGAFLIAVASVFAEAPVAGQTPGGASSASAEPGTAGARPAAQRQERGRGWRVNWVAALSSTYDSNVFRLSPWQLQQLDEGAERFVDMNAGNDVINSLRFRTRLQGPGLAAQKLDLTATARLDVYTFSPRQSNARIGLAAGQSLSRRDRITAEASFAPSGSRRHYLSGAAESGAPIYTAGQRQALDGSIGYERTVWGRRRGPELNAALRLVASSQSFPGFAWRDRRELGAELAAEVTAGRAAVELSGGLARATYSGGPEPVLLDGAVTMMALARDFHATRLDAAASLWLNDAARVGLRLGHRTRLYRATLAEDPVYGNRRDNGWRYGADMRLRTTQHVAVVLGGDVQRQFAFRPGRGDTGDEARYSRSAAFLRVEYAR